MAQLNDNYLKLKAGYLFPEIGRRVKAFCDANPEAAKRLIRCGIGDVTEPLPPAAIAAAQDAQHAGGPLAGAVGGLHRLVEVPLGVVAVGDAAARHPDVAAEGPEGVHAAEDLRAVLVLVEAPAEQDRGRLRGRSHR